MNSSPSLRMSWAYCMCFLKFYVFVIALCFCIIFIKNSDLALICNELYFLVTCNWDGQVSFGISLPNLSPDQLLCVREGLVITVITVNDIKPMIYLTICAFRSYWVFPCSYTFDMKLMVICPQALEVNLFKFLIFRNRK